jgi:hypothetical protein
LYYYNARYYDPAIGRFISADSIIQDFANPQSYNRYSYVQNNPLKYIDPSGNLWETVLDVGSFFWSFGELVTNPSWENAGYLLWDTASIALPFVPGSYIGKAVNGFNKVGGKIIDSTGKAFKSFTKWNLKDNLKLLTGVDDAMISAGKLQAHHWLPSKFEDWFKDVFKNAGVDSDVWNINNPQYASWVGPEHQIWSKWYNNRWQAFIDKYRVDFKRLPSIGEIEAEIKRLAGQLSDEYQYYEINF